MTSAVQRWASGSPRWRPATEGGFEPDRYDVAEISEGSAAAFIREHHYAPTLPSTTYRFGLFDHHQEQPRLVGVATLGVPMSRRVLTNAFPTLVPYEESLEFNRLVLLDDVRANGESWFCARAFRAAAASGVRGIVTFADPVPRWRTSRGRAELVKPGHVGIVYQSLNFTYADTATPRSLILLPDATALSARAIAKVTAGDQGHRGVIARLVALGGRQPADGEDLKLWLADTLRAVGARRIRHPGNHRYVLRIGGSRSERTRTVIGFAHGRYPKPNRQLAIDTPPHQGDSATRCSTGAVTRRPPVLVAARARARANPSERMR